MNQNFKEEMERVEARLARTVDNLLHEILALKATNVGLVGTCHELAKRVVDLETRQKALKERIKSLEFRMLDPALAHPDQGPKSSSGSDLFKAVLAGAENNHREHSGASSR